MMTKRRRKIAFDPFSALMQKIYLIFGAVGAIYGQAEMLGEPWRHILTVGCIVVLVGVAIWRSN